MARTQLTCPCGWVFFVGEISPNGVKCPNCGEQVVRGKGRAKMTAGQIASQKQGQSKMMMYGICVIVAVVLVGGLTFGFLIGGGGGGRSANKDAKIKILGEVDSARKTNSPTEHVERPGDPKTEPTRPVNPDDTKDWGRMIDHVAWRSNVAGVVGELLRLKGDNAKAKELEDRMSDWDRQIEAYLDKMRERNEGHAVPEHMTTGDRLLFFRGVDFGKASPTDKEKALTGALRSLRVGDMWEYTILRSKEVVGFVTYFKERPKELLSVIEQYGNIIGGAPPADGDRPLPVTARPEFAPAPKPVALPADVVAAVKERFLGLPGYYQKYLPPEERTRLDALLRDGMGIPDDVDFLKSRVLLQIVNDAGDEIAFIKAQVGELKEKAAQSTGGTDVILKNDGSRIDGRILEEKDEYIKIEFIRGTVKGAVTVPRGDIKEVRKGAGAASEFPAKLEAAKGKAAPLLELAAWCKERGLGVQRDWVFYQVLDVDPGNDGARTGLGYMKNEYQVYSKDREARRKGNQIDYAGRTYTVEQFITMLKSRGYMEINGVWYGRKAWSVKIASLYKDDGKLRAAYDNSAMIERVKTEKEKTYDIQTKTYKDTIKRVTLGRMIAPLGAGATIRSGSEDVYGNRSGSVSITIESPTEMMECKIRAVSEITMMGGTVRVSVSNDDGGVKELYVLNTVGRHDRYVDATEIAKGRKRVYLKAEMTSPWVSADTGTVMFLPSTRNDSGVFEVSAQIGDPLKSINALLGGVPVEPGPGPGPKPVDPKAVIMDKDTVIRNIEATAEAVCATAENLDAVISRMQDGTKNLKYTEIIPPEPAYDAVMKYIADPLTFDLKKCTSSALMEIGTWWGKMNSNDRKRFASFFGLRCASSNAKR